MSSLELLLTKCLYWGLCLGLYSPLVFASQSVPETLLVNAATSPQGGRVYLEYADNRSLHRNSLLKAVATNGTVIESFGDQGVFDLAKAFPIFAGDLKISSLQFDGEGNVWILFSVKDEKKSCFVHNFHIAVVQPDGQLSKKHANLQGKFLFQSRHVYLAQSHLVVAKDSFYVVFSRDIGSENPNVRLKLFKWSKEGVADEAFQKAENFVSSERLLELSFKNLSSFLPGENSYSHQYEEFVPIAARSHPDGSLDILMRIFQPQIPPGDDNEKFYDDTEINIHDDEGEDDDEEESEEEGEVFLALLKVSPQGRLLSLSKPLLVSTSEDKVRFESVAFLEGTDDFLRLQIDEDDWLRATTYRPAEKALLMTVAKQLSSESSEFTGLQLVNGGYQFFTQSKAPPSEALSKTSRKLEAFRLVLTPELSLKFGPKILCSDQFP